MKLRTSCQLTPLVLVSAIASANTDKFVLEEVIVTAQKTPESLQDVPISMSAVNGQAIADAGITDLQTLSGNVPGLQIGNSATGNNIFIRGVGSGTNRAFEQSVGMYIDGAYMGRSAQYYSPFLDVDRVEVLRGPQGVLFGKNTVAGVINITTASPNPGDETSARTSIEYEPETGTKSYQAMINTSLTDNLAGRIAIKHRDADGWMNNALAHQEEPANKETSARITLAWHPSDDIVATLKVAHSKVESSGNPIVVSAYAPVSANPAELGAVSSLAPIGFAVMNAAYPQLGNFVDQDFVGYKNNNTLIHESGFTLENDNVVLNIDWHLDEFSISSVTAYSEYQSDSGIDGDFGPLDFVSAGANQEFTQISQEFRLATEWESPIQWTLGAYFEKQTLDNNNAVGINSSFGQPAIVNGITGHNNLFSYLTGGTYNVDSIYRHNYFEQDAETSSVFAQATWEISETLRATFGVRYAVDRKEVDKSLVMTDDNLGYDASNSDPDNYPLQAVLDGMWARFGTERHNFNGIDRKVENLTPGINIEWDMSDDAMIYLSYSEGYKSGGFNGADDMDTLDLDGDGVGETPASDFEYEDEEVKTLEIGGKFTLAEGSMRLNWALFHTEYSNLQVTSFNGTSFTVGNAAETTIEGFEAEWEWQSSEYLNLRANIAYLDYAYDNYENASCNVDAQLQHVLNNPGSTAASCAADLSGETGVFAPEWSGAINISYERPLGDSLNIQLGADANFRDDYYADDDLNDASFQDATWKYNLRAGISSADDTWALMLYGNNITNEQTLTSSQDAPLLPGMHVGYADQGRVWGLRAIYNFQ